MKKLAGIGMILSSLFLCSLTVNADVVLGPQALGADIMELVGLLPWVILVIVLTVVIIVRMKNKK